MYSQKNSKEERSESKKEKIISIIYLLEPHSAASWKAGGVGLFFGFGYRGYNFSLGLGFSG